MKKYIVLFLLCGFFGNAQYNLFARQNFANKTVSTSINTEIGGVASTISTPALLAARLDILESRITNFSIVDSDIKCRITGSYNVYWNTDTTITYYKDLDSLATFMEGCFNFCTNLIDVYSKTIGSLGLRAFDTYNSSSKIEKIYLPNITNFGGSVGDNQVFRDMTIHPFTIYCHPSLATNNGGAPDGDLAYAISRGATVRYVTNFTVPNAPNIASIGNIYNYALQLIDNGTSTNAIDYYEDVTVNGVNIGKVSVGGYITGLTPSTSYTITAVARDIFYNKSVVSGNISISTNTTSWLEHNTVAAYHLSDGVDSKNGYNGTVGSSVTFVTGVNGNSANFNATSNSYISVPDNSAFSFTNGTNDLPFSISFKLKLTSNGIGFLVAKTSGGFATNAAEWCVYNSSGSLIILFSNKTSGYLASQFATSLTTGVWYDIVMTYSGSGTNAGVKLYVNNVSKSYTNINSGSYTSMQNTASLVTFGQEKAGAGSYSLNGILDEVYIFNAELTPTEVNLLQTTFYPF